MSDKTELWNAVKNGDIDRIKELVARGVDVNIHDRWLCGLPGKTALHVAAEHGQLDSARVLIELGADIDAIDVPATTTPLCIAAYRDDTKMIALLTEHGANPNVSYSSGGMLFRKYPILHTVIWKGNKKAALALIAGGANVKLADRDGNTPLHAAGHACASEIVRALLKKGADPKVRNNQRELPKM